MVRPILQGASPPRYCPAAHPARVMGFGRNDRQPQPDGGTRACGTGGTWTRARQVLHREPGGSVPVRRLHPVCAAEAGAILVVPLAALEHVPQCSRISALPPLVSAAEQECWHYEDRLKLGACQAGLRSCGQDVHGRTLKWE